MIPPLHTIATKCDDAEICSLAEDLRVCIGTLGAVWSEEMEAQASRYRTDKKGPNSAPVQSVKCETKVVCGQGSSQSPFQKCLSELEDPLIPVQGHALIKLTNLVYSRDPDTLQHTTTLLQLFKEKLSHGDSYLYLAAINALVALALSLPSTSQQVLTTLCQEYACLSGRPNPKARLAYDKDTGQPLATSTVTRDDSKSCDLETRMKLGEALVRVFRESSNMLPHFLGDIVASLLTGVRDPEPLIRASSLSNLAEICSAGRGVLATIITEVHIIMYMYVCVCTCVCMCMYVCVFVLRTKG